MQNLLGNVSHSQPWVDRFTLQGEDGGPIDIDEDAAWAEGVLVVVTPEGRAQIESVVGHLDVHVHARRTFSAELDKVDKWASTVERV